MDDWYDDSDGEQEEPDLVEDDKLLCDLHLNSALNLDRLAKVQGRPLPYDCYFDQRLDKSVKHTKRVHSEWLRSEYKEHPQTSCLLGIIPAKIELSKVSDSVECWDDDVVMSFLDHLQTAFLQRTLHMKFESVRQGLSEGTLTVPEGLILRFQRLMTVALATSEVIRGGDLPLQLSGEVVLIDRVVCSEVALTKNKKMWVSTDGTSVLMTVNGVTYTSIWTDLLASIDLIGQRICSFLSHSIALRVGEPGGISHVEHIKILRSLDKVLEEYGNDGYKLIGMFETACVGQILSTNPDGINDHMGLLRNMYEEISEIIESLELEEEAVMKQFDTLMDALKELRSDQLSNVFCEYRIWGHPYVDVYKGMKKVHSVGTANKVISPYLPKYMVHVFKEYLVCGIFDKTTKYPNGMIDQSLGMNDYSYIERQIYCNRAIEKYAPGYSLEDWGRINIPQCFSVPSTYDITHILNDKAISPKLSKIIEAVVKGTPLDRMDGRRGILSWLEGNTVNCYALLKAIGTHGINKDDLVIGMYEKEREMKIDARMFALMSETMRYYFVITEGLIADHLLPLFPQITMKDSLNKLQKRMWTAGGGSDSERFNVNVNIDFSKWNTNMRGKLMTPLFREMDRAFGLDKVIERTHDIFSQSLIYSCSGNYIPKACADDILGDPPMCYRGHQGGMEGLRQKGWTIGTVCLIEYVARVCNIRYKLMGQGDNQIIKLLMPERLWREYLWNDDICRAEAKSITEKFITCLEQTFMEVGLPVKPKECWRSHNLFMYGKSMLLGQAVLPQWSKKLLRSYALSNEGVMTLGGTIGTISANCMSSSVTMRSPEMAYSMFLLLGTWTLRFLCKYHPFCRDSDLCNISYQFKIPGDRKLIVSPPCSFYSICVALLLIPSACGGAITIPFTTYICRGFPDPLSEAYSWIKLLGEGNSHTIRSVSRCFFGFIKSKKVNIDLLMISPLSANHARALSPNLSAKEESLKFLREHYGESNNIVNTEMYVSDRYQQVGGLGQLVTDPVNPLLIGELAQCFPHFVMRDLISRVQTTRTIKKISLRESKRPIIKRMQQGERDFIGYLRWRSITSGVIYSQCATQQARIVRDSGWDRTIIGVTTPHPLELCKVTCYQSTICSNPSDYIYVKRDREGHYPPYLGSTIRNKVVSMGDENVRKEPLLGVIAKLASYANWMMLGSGFRTTILDLGEKYGGEFVSQSILREYSTGDNFSGSADHRMKSGAMSDGCFINYAPQVGSDVFLSSDQMPKYGRGNTNFTLHFQALYCWIQWIVHRSGILSYGHIHMECEECIVPVTSEIPDIPDSRNLIDEPSCRRVSEVLGLERVSPVEMQDHDINNMEMFLETSSDISLIQTRFLRISLTIYLAVRVSQELMCRTQDENEDFDTGIADLQRYPRVYGMKIYEDELVLYVGVFCLLIACTKKDMGVDGVGFHRAKKYVLDRLGHAPKAQMVGLASLTVDRRMACPEVNGCLGTFCASFPVGLDEHTRGVIAHLKTVINNMGAFDKNKVPPVIYIPVLDCTPRDLSIIGLFVDTVKYHCGEVLRAYQEKEATILHVECPKQRMTHRPLLLTIYPIKASLDKMFKLLSSTELRLITINPPMISTERHISSINLSERMKRAYPVPGTMISGNNLSMYREITLPTSSVYKWEEWLSQCDEYPRNIIILGDGTGGTSLIFGTRFPKAKIYPMSYLEHGRLIPQDMGAFSPPISSKLANVNISAMLQIPDDIESDDFKSCFERFLECLNDEECWIVSDIEMRGGSILKSLQWKFLLKTHRTCVFKIYMPELDRNDDFAEEPLSALSYFLPMTGNLNYGESIIKAKSGARYVSYGDLLKTYLEQKETIHNSTAIQLIRQISKSHGYLRMISLHLSLAHLDALGFPLTSSDMVLSPCELLMGYLSHVNTHYHFIAESLKASDGRVITPLRRMKLERALQILLIATCSRYPNDEDLSQLKMMNWKHGVVKGFPFRVGVALTVGYWNHTTKKDLQAAGCVREFRLSCGAQFRQVIKTSTRMSENQHELLGFMSHVRVKDIFYSSSSTFESGTCYESLDQ
uniref:RNA-directed RNA polymerase n=1 Tax=Sciadopitys virus 1_Chi TaxID=2977987 RepID=A0A9N6YIY1_9RHAB|nr:TPA_asm: polyprotein [Sciadopitys virus 1_Chi]